MLWRLSAMAVRVIDPVFPPADTVTVPVPGVEAATRTTRNQCWFAVSMVAVNGPVVDAVIATAESIPSPDGPLMVIAMRTEPGPVSVVGPARVIEPTGGSFAPGEAGSPQAASTARRQREYDRRIIDGDCSL